MIQRLDLQTRAICASHLGEEVDHDPEQSSAPANDPTPLVLGMSSLGVLEPHGTERLQGDERAEKCADQRDNAAK